MPERLKDQRGRPQVFKRTVKIGERQTSVHLEAAFWVALKSIAAAQRNPVGHLIAAIDSERRERLHANLSSAVRLYVLAYYRSKCSPERTRPSSNSG
jgi:predicted DNA-binding ribbon-helix-helix protein